MDKGNRHIKVMTLEDEPLRSEGVQHATEEERRTSTSRSRADEAAGPKPKGRSVADMPGSERKVQCCKEKYCIGTWKIRQWAILKARSLGKVDRDDYYNIQEVLTCLFRVIELDHFENSDTYNLAIVEKGNLILLPRHLYDTTSYKNYWLGICMLLMVLEEQAMDLLLFGPDKQIDFMPCIMKAMKKPTEGSLPEMTELVLEAVLGTPRLLVLGDFNIHVETAGSGASQDFMAAMTTMGLFQHVTGPTHKAGHTLDLVFWTGQEEGEGGGH
ncbi:uncharacterized protein LOC128406005 [Podarcis raffonei]|uniref:uncharacterized protein LOC128406005 n=1 Tax=Podarcis raffonei TaxID=65483 RepID=UPI00232975AB|nr:uncharacterized protein LOC128406005 [Podarcis raffonei]